MKGRRSFARGIAAYCTAFYTEQRKAEDRYPVADHTSPLAFDREAAKAARTTERLLDDVQPPSDLAAAYDRFVANAHEVSEARADMVDAATTGQDQAAGGAFEAAISARWPLATELHAPGCDGQLPPRQQAAVVQALEKFETISDSMVACRDLATPGYLATRWSDLPDPLAGCVATRVAEARAGAGRPAQISVQSVTGSDGIAATAHYTGGCGCPDGGVARLHLVNGAWLISERSHQ